MSLLVTVTMVTLTHCLCIAPLEGMELAHTLHYVESMFDWHGILHYQDHMMAHNKVDQLAHAFYIVILFYSSSSHKLLG